jgi:lipoate-protein ligase A
MTSAPTDRPEAAARLLLDPALPGALNMARDEALLLRRSAPTLRFYRWARPTLSLGWFQSAAELPLDAVLARGGEVVRRPTGGKAILHEHELTYALCAPEEDALAGGPAAAMRAIHDALAAELGRQSGADLSIRGAPRLLSDAAGSAWCFEDSSPLDLALAGRKVLGSAARRRAGWVLFHGSLVLARLRENPGIGALGREPDAPALAAALGRALGHEFRPGAWLPEELADAERIRAKYEDPAHVHRL